MLIFFTSFCASLSYKENTSTQWNFTHWPCYSGYFEAIFGGVRRYFLKDHYKEITDFLDPGMIQISENTCHVESYFQAFPPPGLEWWEYREKRAFRVADTLSITNVLMVNSVFFFNLYHVEEVPALAEGSEEIWDSTARSRLANKTFITDFIK